MSWHRPEESPQDPPVGDEEDELLSELEVLTLDDLKETQRYQRPRFPV